MEENGLATKVIAKRLLGVASKVNQRKCVICMPPPSVNKGMPILALKPGGDITISPKQEYQWLHQTIF